MQRVPSMISRLARLPAAAILATTGAFAMEPADEGLQEALDRQYAEEKQEEAQRAREAGAMEREVNALNRMAAASDALDRATAEFRRAQEEYTHAMEYLQSILDSKAGKE